MGCASITRETQLKELTVKTDKALEEGLSSQRGEAQGYSDTWYLIRESRVHRREHQTHHPPPPGDGHSPRVTLGNIPTRHRSHRCLLQAW